MPVDFLTEAQKRRYGRYPDEVSAVQLARFFHIDDTDRVLIGQRRGDANRLGFALQLLTVRFLGTFLANPIEVPANRRRPRCQAARNRCLPVCRATWIANRRGTPIEPRFARSTATAISVLPGRFRLSRWLYLRAWLGNERPSLLFDLATAWLIEHKILLSGRHDPDPLGRPHPRAHGKPPVAATLRVTVGPAARPTRNVAAIPEGARYSHLDRLRRGPTRVSAPALIVALQRHEELQALGVGKLDFSGIPPVRIKRLARYAATAWAPNIVRMPRQRRIATLLAFVSVYEVNALDDALDVLDMLITEIAAQAKRLGQKQRLRTLRDLDQAALTLREACSILLDPQYSDRNLREAVFERIPEALMRRAVETIDTLARPADDNYKEELVERYLRVRRFLPFVLRHVQFQGTATGHPVLDALQFLRSIEGKRGTVVDDAPLEIVSPAWRRLVIEKDNRVNRPAYTLCAMDRLQDSLRRRDLYVSPSERWGDPRAKLLQGARWQAERKRICRSLKLPLNAEEAVRRLRAQLDAAYRRTLDNLPDNEAVSIDEDNRERPLTLSNLDKIDEPESLIALRDRVADLLPRVDLPEILLEIHLRTGFADAFTHISEGAVPGR